MAELRQDKVDRVLTALVSGAGTRREIAHARELRSRSTATNACIAHRLAFGHPTRAI